MAFCSSLCTCSDKVPVNNFHYKGVRRWLGNLRGNVPDMLPNWQAARKLAATWFMGWNLPENCGGLLQDACHFSLHYSKTGRESSHWPEREGGPRNQKILRNQCHVLTVAPMFTRTCECQPLNRKKRDVLRHCTNFHTPITRKCHLLSLARSRNCICSLVGERN